MVSTPLLVGIVASRPAWVHVPLTAFWFLGYFAFFAAGLWLKSRRRARYRGPVLAYGIAAAIAGGLTLALDPTLIHWAPLFILPLGIGLAASARRDDRSLWSGLTTTVGASLMAVVAYDAGGGTDFPRIWLLTGVLAAYFAGTVLYVKTLIRERGSEVYYWVSVVFHAAVTLAMIPLAPALTPVFALLTVRAAIAPAFPVTPKQAGIGEIAATIVVVLTALLVT